MESRVTQLNGATHTDRKKNGQPSGGRFREFDRVPSYRTFVLVADDRTLTVHCRGDLFDQTGLQDRGHKVQRRLGLREQSL